MTQLCFIFSFLFLAKYIKNSIILQQKWKKKQWVQFQLNKKTNKLYWSIHHQLNKPWFFCRANTNTYIYIHDTFCILAKLQTSLTLYKWIKEETNQIKFVVFRHCCLEVNVLNTICSTFLLLKKKQQKQLKSASLKNNNKIT